MPLAPVTSGESSDGIARGARLELLADVTPQQLRQSQISEFTAWLRTQTNRHKRPFQEATITGYTEACRALDRWMADVGVDEDFTGCDVEILIRFFASYRNSHSQNGANTRQRNLHHMFKWLSVRHDHPDPWLSPELVRYGPVKSRPSTLDTEFIRDLLAVTGDGKDKSFSGWCRSRCRRRRRWRRTFGPAGAQAGVAARSVAGIAEPRADDRVRRLPDAGTGAARKQGTIRRKFAPICSVILSPMTGSPAAGPRAT
jgi:hypothetical protein